jgi:transposase InsO family protein
MGENSAVRRPRIHEVAEWGGAESRKRIREGARPARDDAVDDLAFIETSRETAGATHIPENPRKLAVKKTGSAKECYRRDL